MGTQKTNLPDHDSGVAINTESQQDDMIEISGRKLRRVSPEEMQRKIVEETIARGADTPLSPSVPRVPDNMAKEIENMIPEYMKTEHNKTQQNNTDRDNNLPIDPRTISMLGEEIKQAKMKGDEDLANKLQHMLERAITNDSVERKHKPKKTHPVLNKLKQTLGLQKIKPLTVEWGGFKWLFYPSNAVLDAWVYQMMGAHNFSALKICSMLVGLDDTPLYDVLSVDLVANYTTQEGEEMLDVPVYVKICDMCGIEIEVKSEKCHNCGSQQDLYDMPIDLRLYCANQFHEWLIKNFGPYEDLADLLSFVQQQMKDRLNNKDELYPFLKNSPSISTMIQD